MGDRFFYRQEPAYWGEAEHYITFTLMRTGASVLDLQHSEVEARIKTGEDFGHQARMWCHENLGQDGLGRDWAINSTATRIHIHDRNMALAFKMRWG